MIRKLLIIVKLMYDWKNICIAWGYLINRNIFMLVKQLLTHHAFLEKTILTFITNNNAVMLPRSY